MPTADTRLADLLRPRPAPIRRIGVAMLLALAATSAFAQTDADFLAAKAAYDKGDRARLGTLAPKLNGHVLAPYVGYWQLKLGMDDASPEAIRTFIDRHPNTPLADRLRADWLKYLGRRANWSRFGADYAPPLNADVNTPIN